MFAKRKKYLKNEKGFALVAALIACLILLALGMLVINMSTGDLFTTSAVIGNKKSLAAAESGISKIIADVDPDNWTTTEHYTVATDGSGNLCGTDAFDYDLYDFIDITGGTDPNTEFAVCIPRPSAQPPLPASGYGLSGGGSSAVGYAYMRYDSTVVGRNTSHDAEAKVDVGVGFGPVPLGGN